MHHIFSRQLFSGVTRRFTQTSINKRQFSQVFDHRDLINDSPINNITENIRDHVGAKLHHRRHHPLTTTKTMIAEYFANLHDGKDGNPQFKLFDDLAPVVTTKQCFDDLLIPADHVGRQPSDTYYVNDNQVLRTHTSAHQCELIRGGNHAFLCAGDVYRRDAIDASHYPVFHQMEGVYIFPDEPQYDTAFAEEKLKSDLAGMVRTVFGDVEMKWVDAYFPFTTPSMELEIFFEGEWLEVLGCGVIHPQIMENCGLGHRTGYAFGLGLERLAMVLFGIPDIRLFWSADNRFSRQFKDGEITKFVPYSKYPPCYKDVSFWLPEGYNENDFYSLVRSVGGDLVEKVTLIDSFTHPKSNKESHCYRIVYRSMDRNLTNEEVDVIQEEVRTSVEGSLKGTLR